jgi:hypothetical protein
MHALIQSCFPMKQHRFTQKWQSAMHLSDYIFALNRYAFEWSTLYSVIKINNSLFK